MPQKADAGRPRRALDHSPCEKVPAHFGKSCGWLEIQRIGIFSQSARFIETGHDMRTTRLT